MNVTAMSSNVNNSSSLVLLSRSEQDFILDGCRLQCRLDGRTCTELRSYTIVTAGVEASHNQDQDHEKNNNNNNKHNSEQHITSMSSLQAPLILSHGSARIFGSSHDSLHLLCSVKAELVQPMPPDIPADEGIIEFHVDRILAATGNDTSQQRRQRHVAATIESILTRLILPNIDKRRLCIQPGYACWRLVMDWAWITTTPEAAGLAALLDAASHVLCVALHQTVLPAVTVIAKQPSQHNSASDQQQTQSSQVMSSSLSNTTTNTSAAFDLIVNSDIAAAHPVIAADVTAGADSKQTVDRTIPVIVTVTVLHCPTSSSTITPSSMTGNIATEFVFILDATAHEEAVAHAQVHVAVRWVQGTCHNNSNNHHNRSNNNSKVMICGVTKTGSGALPVGLLPRILQVATDAVPNLHHHYHIVTQTSTPTATTGQHMLQEQLLLLL